MSNSDHSAACRRFSEVVMFAARMPGSVAVVDTVSTGTVDLLIRCHPSDAPRLVGERGCGLKALAVIAKRLWWRTGKWVSIERVQDDGSDTPSEDRPWDEVEFTRFFAGLASEVFEGEASVELDSITGAVSVTAPTASDTRRDAMVADALALLATLVAGARGRRVKLRVNTAPKCR